VTGEAAERYRQRLAARAEQPLEPPTELAEAVLRGEIRLADLKDRTDIQVLQDDVAMVGQGRIPDYAHERLGRSDVSGLLQRTIWARELQALAEGGPLTRWAGPPRGLVEPIRA